LKSQKEVHTNKLIVVFLAYFIAVSACAPVSAQVKPAMNQAKTFVPYPTQTPYPTGTPYPTKTPEPKMEVLITPEDEFIKWGDLMRFLEKDRTNANIASEMYQCVNYSMDLVDNANAKKIKAWVIAVLFESSETGHAFVAFPTSDSGIVWVEPQTDGLYRIPKVGESLCLSGDPAACVPGGKIIEIMQPAFCDKVTYHCK
jgi:hypothetical protein